ncbi:hypothetical protein OH76DRAFT_843577 [Lentinus brumalis]|uniref:Uncharacterized protein n=1 Tax=Lentinus brumalis TaxID=2498619 RepID=A0A371DQM6_9APHY|nr:hypothetical protein OH76DRAFT_843577 [Polyporus brumalis]
MSRGLPCSPWSNRHIPPSHSLLDHRRTSDVLRCPFIPRFGGILPSSANLPLVPSRMCEYSHRNAAFVAFCLASNIAIDRALGT